MNMKRRYGFYYTERCIMLESQNHKCKICEAQIEFNGNKTGQVSNKNAVVDHCHNTNKVRGIICGSCNILLGKSKDNTNILNNAIKYLQERLNETSNHRQ
jgi:hypothetical protein